VHRLSLTHFDTATTSPFLDIFPAAAAAAVEVLRATFLPLHFYFQLGITCELLASSLGGAIWQAITVMRAELFIMNQLSMLISKVVLAHVQVEDLLLLMLLVWHVMR